MPSCHDPFTAVVELVLGGPTPSPSLIGGVYAEDTVQLHVIPLDPADPLADLAELVAPAEWDFIILHSTVVVREQDGTSPEAALTHALDRTGRTVTRIRRADRTTSVHQAIGPIRSACEQVLAEVGSRRSMHHGRS